MAFTLTLVRLDDFISDVDSVDLLANGYKMAPDGYRPTVAPIGAKSCYETITLNIAGTSHDHLATLVQALDAKIEQIKWWLDNPGIERYQVWLRAALTSETNARQAMLLNIVPATEVKIYNKPEQNANFIAQYQIGFERTPYWEDPYPYPTAGTLTTIDSIGGTAAIAGTIGGDVPARLGRVIFNETGGSLGPTDFWIGFKSNRMGTASNFSPVWPLYHSSFYGPDTAGTAEATAYAGSMVSCSFATTTTMVYRDYITLEDLAAVNGGHYADQRGNYTVLLRAKMRDASTAQVRMAFAIGGSNFVFRSSQVISGTSWKFYEMGNMSLPPQQIANYQDFRSFVVGLQARLLTSSGALNLDLDCLVLIPSMEGMIKLTSDFYLTSSQNYYGNVYQTADDRVYAVRANNSNVIAGMIVAKPQNYGLPTGTASIVVMAAQNSSNGSLKSTSLTFNYTYIPRWRTLRGGGA